MMTDRELLEAVRAEGPHSKAVEDLIRRFEDDVRPRTRSRPNGSACRAAKVANVATTNGPLRAALSASAPSHGMSGVDLQISELDEKSTRS